MNKCEFTVAAPPVPLARPRLGKGYVYTPKRSQQHKALLGWAATKARPRDWLQTGHFAVYLGFYVTNNKGDLDNYIKLTLDSLQGILFENDRDVTTITAYKRLVKDNPMTRILVARED